MASPTGRPSRRPPSPPDPVLQQRAWTAMAMGALSLGGLFLASGLRHAIYVVAGTLVIGAVAAWLGRTAMSQARPGLQWAHPDRVRALLEPAVGLLELHQRGQHAHRPAGLSAPAEPDHHQQVRPVRPF